MTGAAIQALIAAGRGRNDAVEEGIAYLRGAQNADGGFPEFPGNPESNVASTAWAVQGIWAVGENPEDWRVGSGAATKDPLGYMESMQQPDGHIRWKLSQDLNGIWMTAYCSVALGGHAWPIPEQPLSNDPIQLPKSGEGGGTQGGQRRDRRRRRRGAPALQPSETAEQGQDPRRQAGDAQPAGQGPRPQPNQARRERPSTTGPPAPNPPGRRRPQPARVPALPVAVVRLCRRERVAAIAWRCPGGGIWEQRLGSWRARGQR